MQQQLTVFTLDNKPMRCQGDPCRRHVSANDCTRGLRDIAYKRRHQFLEVVPVVEGSAIYELSVQSNALTCAPVQLLSARILVVAAV
eukprot:3301825-Amphidinium_carterae.1